MRPLIPEMAEEMASAEALECAPPRLGEAQGGLKRHTKHGMLKSAKETVGSEHDVVGQGRQLAPTGKSRLIPIHLVNRWVLLICVHLG